MTENIDTTSKRTVDTEKEERYHEIAKDIAGMAALIGSAIIIRGGLVIAASAVAIVAAAIVKVKSDTQENV